MGNLLDHVVVGYENVEPVIVANVALRMNFILVGCRGTCKTTLARTLAHGYAALLRLDEALLDRFYMVSPVPDFARGVRKGCSLPFILTGLSSFEGTGPTL